MLLKYLTFIQALAALMHGITQIAAGNQSAGIGLLGCVISLAIVIPHMKS